MKVVISGASCVVTREPGDPVFRDSGWGSSESTLLYYVQQALKAQGMDLVKKRMWKDGHMVDEHVHYLRARSKRTRPSIAIWDNLYAVRNSAEEFNERGRVVFEVVEDYWQVERFKTPVQGKEATHEHEE